MKNTQITRHLKAGIDLPIVARPTLNSREVLTRITQRETRRVMVFEREREREGEISRSSRKMMVLKRERACGSYILGNEEAVGLHQTNISSYSGQILPCETKDLKASYAVDAYEPLWRKIFKL